MAFTVEDGTGLNNANAFISVDFFSDYHEDRGNESLVTLAEDETVIQACIIKATDYISKRFGRRFRGQRQSSQQALPFPRLGFFDDDNFDFPEATDGIPLALAQATAEYAARVAIYHELAPDPLLPVPVQDFEEPDHRIPGTIRSALRLIRVRRQDILLRSR